MYSCAISLEAEKAKNCFEQKGKAKKCGTFCRLSHFSGESGRQMAITFKAKYTFDDTIYIHIYMAITFKAKYTFDDTIYIYIA
jgi:hypothetical protein